MNYIDEGHIIRHAQNMYKANSIQPYWYLYGSAMMNLTNSVVSLRLFFADDKESVKESIKIYPQGYYENIFPSSVESEYSIVYPGIFLTVGRFIVFIFFLLAVFFLYLISARFLPTYFSLIPSFLLLTIPILAEYSVYVHNDIPMMSILVIVVYLTLKWHEKKNICYVFIASFLSGISCGMKYTGVLSLGFLFMYILASNLRQKNKFFLIILSSLFLILGFYASSPGILGHENEAIKVFLEYNNYYSHKPGSYLSYLKAFFINGEIGFVFSTLAFLSLVVLPFTEVKENKKFFIISSLWLTGFFLVFLRYQYQPTRNIFSSLPLLCLSASYLFYRFTREFKTYKLGLLLSSVIFLSLVISQFIFFEKSEKRVEARVDSRIEFFNWLNATHDSLPKKYFYLDHIAISPEHINRLKNNLVKLNIESLRRMLVSNLIDSKALIVLPESSIENKVYDDVIHRLNKSGFKEVKVFGRRPIYFQPNFFRPGDMKISIFAKV